MTHPNCGDLIDAVDSSGGDAEQSSLCPGKGACSPENAGYVNPLRDDHDTLTW